MFLLTIFLQTILYIARDPIKWRFQNNLNNFPQKRLDFVIKLWYICMYLRRAGRIDL